MLTIDVAADPALSGVVPGPIYPIFGVLTAGLALAGGIKGVRCPPSAL